MGIKAAKPEENSCLGTALKNNLFSNFFFFTIIFSSFQSMIIQVLGFSSFFLLFSPLFYILEAQALENTWILWKEFRDWGTFVIFPLPCNPRDCFTEVALPGKLFQSWVHPKSGNVQFPGEHGNNFVPKEHFQEVFYGREYFN